MYKLQTANTGLGWSWRASESREDLREGGSSADVSEGYGDPREGVAGVSGAWEEREGSTGGSKGWEGTASVSMGSKGLAFVSATIADLFEILPRV